MAFPLRIYANPGNAFADALRNFGSSLSVGQTFSLDIAVNFRNGNKGFSLFDGASEIFNLNVGSDDYQINGVSIGAPYSSTAIFNLSLTQTSAAGGTYSVFYNGSGLTYNDSLHWRWPAGLSSTTPAPITAIQANNLYFNNLAITAVPEPSSLILLSGPALLGGLLLCRRRRKA